MTHPFKVGDRIRLKFASNFIGVVVDEAWVKEQGGDMALLPTVLRSHAGRPVPAMWCCPPEEDWFFDRDEPENVVLLEEKL